METDFSKIPWLKDVDKTFLNKLKTIYYFGDLAFMITEDDDCFSIGYNWHGALGIGSDEPQVITPRRITSLCQKKITNFSRGDQHVIAFTEVGKLYTWGYNEKGQLGLGQKDDRFSPVVVEGSLSGKNIIQAACGGYHTLVLTSDGEVFGTGRNSCGELGIGSTTNKSSFVQIKNGIGTSKIIQISCGMHHSAAVSSAGEIFLWGYNYYGQLGTGNKNNQLVPRKLNFQHPIKKVTLGFFHTLALTTNGFLYAWGCNEFGQLGFKSDSECLKEPIQIFKELGVVLEILAFGHFGCCKTDTNAYVWGKCNKNEQLSPKASQFTYLMQAALDADVEHHYQPICFAKKKLHVDLGRGISNASSIFLNGETIEANHYLGYGSFGVVFVTKSQTQELTAKKLIFLDTKEKIKNIQRISDEYEKMKNKYHRNIVKSLGLEEYSYNKADVCKAFQINQSSETRNFPEKVMERFDVLMAKFNYVESIRTLCLEMELCGETLRQWLEAVIAGDINTDNNTRIKITQDIISGLKFLHNSKILHRDLKPSNIYFSMPAPNERDRFNFPIKIGDFGQAREVEGELSCTLTVTGTREYRAPEVDNEHYGTQADLYSLGLIIWEIFHPTPFRIARNKFDDLKYGVDTIIEENQTVLNLKQLIIDLTRKEKSQRLKSIQDVSLQLVNDAV